MNVIWMVNIEHHKAKRTQEVQELYNLITVTDH